MALKKSFSPLEAFSMSSMTDIIFLLLIFFMVTSTLIFPTAMEVNLPESGEQTDMKPVTEVYLTEAGDLFLVADRNDTTGQESALRSVNREQLLSELAMIQQKDSLRAVALYADSVVSYGKVIEVLDMASRNKLKMVLATRSGEDKYHGASLDN